MNYKYKVGDKVKLGALSSGDYPPFSEGEIVRLNSWEDKPTYIIKGETSPSKFEEKCYYESVIIGLIEECICPIMTLMAVGCKCGFIEKERSRRCLHGQ